LVRRSSQLAHFEPAAVADAALRPMIYRIRVVADAALDARGHTAVDLSLTLADGRTLRRQLDIAPGFPGAELTPEQHRARLADCLRYAPRPLGAEREAELLALLGRWHALDDVRALLPALLAA
jgi:2-methylcitrate dehydratase PrpD